jgi:hypothetical protein
MRRSTSIAIAIVTFAAIQLMGCDLDGDAKDTGAPAEDTVAGDVIAPLDTVPPEDAATDTPPPPMDTVEDVPAPPDVLDAVDDIPLQDVFDMIDDIPLQDVFDMIDDIPLPDVFDMIDDVPPPPDIAADLPEMPAACCLSDADCADVGDGGWTCAWGQMEAENPAWGRCMGPLNWDENLCWDDGDCLDGTECVGATYCPCDIGCGMPDVPGICQDPEMLGDVGDLCGQSGGDCKPDLVCCYPCGIPDCQWQCAVPCDESEQWCAGGCPMLP